MRLLESSSSCSCCRRVGRGKIMRLSKMVLHRVVMEYEYERDCPDKPISHHSTDSLGLLRSRTPTQRSGTRTRNAPPLRLVARNAGQNHPFFEHGSSSLCHGVRVRERVRIGLPRRTHIPSFNGFPGLLRSRTPTQRSGTRTRNAPPLRLVARNAVQNHASFEHGSSSLCHGVRVRERVRIGLPRQTHIPSFNGFPWAASFSYSYSAQRYSYSKCPAAKAGGA